MSGDKWEIYKLEYVPVVNQGANALKYLYANFGILKNFMFDS